MASTTEEYLEQHNMMMQRRTSSLLIVWMFLFLPLGAGAEEQRPGLAKGAGGTEACKTVVFESKEDPDYQAILKTFEPLREMLVERPRMDMIGREQANKTGPIRKPAAARPPGSKVTSMFPSSP